MGVGKLKEPGRAESVGFNLLFFIASSALAYTSVGYCPSVPPLDGSQLVSIFILLMKKIFLWRLRYCFRLKSCSYSLTLNLYQKKYLKAAGSLKYPAAYPISLKLFGVFKLNLNGL